MALGKRRIILRSEPDRSIAIRDAIKSAKQDDIVLIAGKGHETGQIVGDKVHKFSDKDVARKRY